MGSGDEWGQDLGTDGQWHLWSYNDNSKTEDWCLCDYTVYYVEGSEANEYAGFTTKIEFGGACQLIAATVITHLFFILI